MSVTTWMVGGKAQVEAHNWTGVKKPGSHIMLRCDKSIPSTIQMIGHRYI